MIQTYTIYNRITLNSKTPKIEGKQMKKIYHANSKQNRSGLLILIIGEINFKTKIVARDKERQFKLNSQSKCSALTYKHLTIQPKITGTKNTTEGRNRQFNNDNWRLQYPLSIFYRTKPNIDKEIDI